MKKIWSVLFWIGVLVAVLLIPTIYGSAIAYYGAGASCTATAAWIAWLKLCIAGSYVMLTVTGPGMLALVVIIAIITRIVYIISH